MLICLASSAAMGEDQPWRWKDSGGVVRTEADLVQALTANRQWMASGGHQGKQAALAHADLHGAELSNADLTGLDLTGANLSDADFTQAKLDKANLTSAILEDADLTQASLAGANLNGAHLKGAYLGGGNLHTAGAELRGARMTNVDLTGADLTNADLTKADLRDARLGDSELEGTNFSGVVYQPTDGPSALSINTAQHLADLRFEDNPQPIILLRNSLFDGGFEQSGREVNRAYRHQGENIVQRVLFDWTCAWGADAGRPLAIMAEVSLLCTLVYWIVIQFSPWGAGLFLVSNGGVCGNGKEKTVRIVVVSRQRNRVKNAGVAGVPRRVGRGIVLEFRALSTAFLFSLMSVFTIGVEGFNCGQWLRMLQPREFDIRATGWARTVSGMQALLGAGLVTLAALSYFGHPFE